MPASNSLPSELVAVAESRQYVSWPAVFAGFAVTGGLILAMLPLGAAAGLAMTSAYPGNSASSTTIGWAAILWLAFMYLFSISAGGYVVGRLRPRLGDAPVNEVRFRDGLKRLRGLGRLDDHLRTLHVLYRHVCHRNRHVGHRNRWERGFRRRKFTVVGKHRLRRRHIVAIKYGLTCTRHESKERC